MDHVRISFGVNTDLMTSDRRAEYIADIIRYVADQVEAGYTDGEVVDQRRDNEMIGQFVIG